MEIRLLSDLHPSSVNPRGTVRGDDVKDALSLVESVKRLGILEPLLIREDGEIVAGHRRYNAALTAGLTEAPVRVLQCSDSDRPEIMIAENVHRKDLAPSEIGQLLQCISRDGISKNKIASITGLPSERVTRLLLLLELPESIRRMVDARTLSSDCIPLLAKLEAETQTKAAELASAGRWGQGKLSQWIHANANGNSPKERKVKSYADKRQTDVAWCIDQCIAMRTRCEKYADMSDLPPFITKIEGRLQSVSKDLFTLADELVESARGKRKEPLL